MFAALPLSRRNVLAGLTAAALIPLPAGAERRSAGRILAMSDLHSAYERTGQLLAALEAETRRDDLPNVIAVNGDVFEKGNVVALRSQGAIDWAFLAELPRLAPTVVNLGNHDNDITPDLAEVVQRLRGLDIAVVSTIVDARTGQPYAPATVELPFGDRRLRVVGMATNALNTYPAASRPTLTLPAPDDWARDNLALALQGADLALVLSHAGVAADRRILPLLPDGVPMVGGHDHLKFQHRQGRSVYAHTGSWSTAYTVLTLGEGGGVEAASVDVSTQAVASPRLAGLIASTLAETLTEQETAVLGVSPRALSLGDTGRAIASAMAKAAGAGAGFIGHTTLGAGLPRGPVSRYAFDAIIRFEGRLMVAEVDRARLAGFLQVANQDRPLPLDQRKGDFLYAAMNEASEGPTRIVTTDWCATNQSEYFGTADLTFRPVFDLSLKAVAQAALLGV